MTDFLLELRSEEIPARMQGKAREDLARLFAAELAKAGLAASELVTYATPRRLALIARDLPDATEAVSEEVKGPKTSAPPQALEGFLRKTGLTREQLIERDGVLFAVTEKPGRATTDLLAEAIPAIIRAFPWPKSMRWGAASASTESLRWVRPLQGIVALFGDAIASVEIAGIESGAATLGHRFHHPGVITIGGAHDYVEKLRACHVIVDQDERATLIRDGARALAAEAGLELIEDEGLVAENAGLTEWPVPLLGRFDEAFLDVPPEVIQLTTRVNQKYFVCRHPSPPQAPLGEGGKPQAGEGAGALANAFICTANIEATDGGAKIVEGNRKVLAARLSDARFFYETDLKVPLEEQARKLEKIVFHEKLGTVADKVERVAKLARWLVEAGIVAPNASDVTGEQETLAKMAWQAARLAKADLVTGMVGEFPELQGLMGGYYALAQGEDPQVAEAIRDHYKPVGQGDEVPTAPVTVAVSLADKLDSIFSFFAAGVVPTGSKDPYALRRAALGVLRLSESDMLQLPLQMAFQFNHYHWLSSLVRRYDDHGVVPISELEVAASDFDAFRAHMHESLWRLVDENCAGEFWNESSARARDPRAWSMVMEFFIDRLKVQQREAGVRHDLIEAAFASSGEDVSSRLLARTHALQAFVGTADGANLLGLYKRAANILKKEGYTELQPLRHPGLDPGSGFFSGDPEEAEPRLGGRGDEGGNVPPIPLSYTPETAEAALIAALDSAEPAAASAVAREDFEGAMAALASLRAPIDAFFETVTVNDSDPTKRIARLALLARVRAAVHTVADFARIEG